MEELSKELLERLAKDPDYLKRAIRSNDLDTFKNRFGVTKASGLRCPACSQYGQSGGSLWWLPEAPETFTCRKCERTYTITCNGEDVFDIIKEIKGK